LLTWGWFCQKCELTRKIVLSREEGAAAAKKKTEKEEEAAKMKAEEEGNKAEEEAPMGDGQVKAGGEEKREGKGFDLFSTIASWVGSVDVACGAEGGDVPSGVYGDCVRADGERSTADAGPSNLEFFHSLNPQLARGAEGADVTSGVYGDRLRTDGERSTADAGPAVESDQELLTTQLRPAPQEYFVDVENSYVSKTGLNPHLVSNVVPPSSLDALHQNYDVAGQHPSPIPAVTFYSSIVKDKEGAFPNASSPPPEKTQHRFGIWMLFAGCDRSCARSLTHARTHALSYT
jgi:hypothetical protein